MYRVFLAWLCLGSVAMGSIVDSQIFINELHYDNQGTDKDEFVEVAAPASWNQLSAASLTVYNGGTGTSYAGPTPLSSFTRREVVGGWAFYTLDVSLQNGAPDGLALALGNQVLQFLSYEGVFTATAGIAQGLESTDMGVWEPADTPLGSSLQLTGLGNSYLDFTWQLLGANTYGTVNDRQSMVPEPAAVVGWLTAGGFWTLIQWRRRLRRLRAVGK
ncbi:MAG: hypothetical protein ACYC3X_24980 [Pirellulaceae bacterium]